MCAAIRNAGRAGVRGLNYNFCPIPHQRTPQSTGRGGTSQSTFHLAEYDQEQRYPVGELSRDEVYARAQYMLERIIPVAEEAGVQMACHLCAPLPSHPPPAHPRCCRVDTTSNANGLQWADTQRLMWQGGPAGSDPRGRGDVELACLRRLQALLRARRLAQPRLQLL